MTLFPGYPANLFPILENEAFPSKVSLKRKMDWKPTTQVRSDTYRLLQQ